ncbi:MAG TPA: hypothetical protein VET65_06750, partial [Candidatus Limnocylindrales bacterium]|nr:hypothetical protein [Candidatus Limnocylindrales bacterium]
RARSLVDQAVWEAACHLVPDVALQRQVIALIECIDFPDWLPAGLRRLPASSKGFFPRIAAAVAGASTRLITHNPKKED